MGSIVADPEVRVYIWNTNMDRDAGRISVGHASLELVYEGKKKYLSYWPIGGGLGRNERDLDADVRAEHRGNNEPPYDSCFTLTLNIKQAESLHHAINEVILAMNTGDLKYQTQNEPESRRFNCSGIVEKVLHDERLVSGEYFDVITEASSISMPNRMAENLRTLPSWKESGIIRPKAKL